MKVYFWKIPFNLIVLDCVCPWVKEFAETETEDKEMIKGSKHHLKTFLQD